MTGPRVLVADDHQAIRVAVREVLELDGCVVCAEATTAHSAVELAETELPDVCLLDLDMPGGGLWALRELRSRVPTTRTMVLTVSDDSADLFDALRGGAAGYLLKDIAPREIPRAVRAVLAGEAVLNGVLTARVIDEMKLRKGRDANVVNAEGHRVRFTPREWDVLELLLDGASTREIADRMFVGQTTVRRHIADLVHKLRAPSRQAVVMMLRRQLRRRPGSDDL